MQCPSCKKNQPMSFRCRYCGADLMKRSAGPARRASASFAPQADAAAAAVALDNPYRAPEVALRSPVKVLYGEKSLASTGSRLAAQCLDGLIALLLYIPLFVSAILGGDSSPGTAIGGVMVSVIGLLGFAVYQLVLLSRQGQTIGKKLMKIRIVRYDDGSNPGFGRAVGLRLFVNGLIGIVPGYVLVDLLFIFGAERRCLHDYIAGTKVVEA